MRAMVSVTVSDSEPERSAMMISVPAGTESARGSVTVRDAVMATQSTCRAVTGTEKFVSENVTRAGSIFDG